jgi:hypothetical protein
MAQDEPSVEELKRLLRRLEKLEPVEAPRAEGLASLRSPLPPSEQFAIPSPRPPGEAGAAPIPTPLVLAPDVVKPPSLRTEPPVALVAVPTHEKQTEPPAAARSEAGGTARGVFLGLAALAVAGGIGAYLVLLPSTPRQVGETRQSPSASTSTRAAGETPAADLAAAPMTPQSATAPVAPAVSTGAASGAGPEPVAAPSPSPPAPSASADTTPPPVAMFEAPAVPFATVGALTTTAPTIAPEPTPAREAEAAPAAEAAPTVVPPPPGPAAPEPTGPRLVTASDWSIGAGRRSAIPLVIDPPSAVMDHYVLIEGLEPDAFVSRSIEVLGGTWMVRGADIEAAEIERAAAAPERATLNLELRHVDGSIVGRQSVSLVAASQGLRKSSAQTAASEPPRAAPETNSGSDAQRLLRRGQLMLDSGNLSGARLLWERAAEQGSSEAALALGRSYDPAQVPLPGVAGSVADRALARRWYDRAAALGSSEARERARTLD